MLSTVSNQPHRRGHAHKRSAAISGDFDVIGMDFFKAPPSNQQSFSQQSHSQSLPKDSFLNTNSTPQFVITDATEKSYQTKSPSRSKSTNSNVNYRSKDDCTNTSSTPSPQKKHTRLNSWAHSFIKPKKNELNEQRSNEKIEYNSSSSNEATPDKTLSSNAQFTYNTKPSNNQYQVPEALIDLDRASGIFHDPSSSIPKKNTIHRRTESAPELEDFLKYKVFSYNQANSNTQQNPAIFEEEEEEEENDEDAISSASSTNNMSSNMKNNTSANSLNSYPSFKLQSPAPVNNNSITSTPVSIKTNATQQNQTGATQGQQRRGGATAARYQSYYNNSLLLSNALKSSESLSQITNGTNSISNKPSISSFTNNKSIISSASSANSSVLNSPSRFKFESKVYDPPSQSTPTPTNPALSSPSSPSSPTSSSTSASSFPKASNHQPSLSQVGSPSKNSKKLYIHKKSNSLLSSISSRMRRNSSASKASEEYETNKFGSQQKDDEDEDEDEDEDIGDSTLTPFNFGEPGPELDLTTMTPKIHHHRNGSFNDINELNNINNNSNSNNNNNNNDTHNMASPIRSKSPSRGHHHHHHHSKKFFNWLKK